MNKYVFDSGPFITLFNYFYPKRFPTLWRNFFELLQMERIVSTREVLNELDRRESGLKKWAHEKSQIFRTPSREELKFVSEIFSNPHFHSMIRKKELMQGSPVADPFVIALAACMEPRGIVVTTEILTPHASKIPNVCEHFSVPWMGLEAFMEAEGWLF